MAQFVNKLLKFVGAEDGPTAVEYAVVLGLVVVFSISAITTLGTRSKGTVATVNTSMTPHGSQGTPGG